MKSIAFGLFAAILVPMVHTRSACLLAQDAPAVATGNKTSRLIVGHPFSAIKFAHRVKVLPNGRQQFLRNERYPMRIARDAGGRLMMQGRNSDDLAPECDRLDLLVPPPCPAWRVFVIDPVAHTVTHWPEGEIAAHGAVEYPLTPARLEEVADSTSSMPSLGPEFSQEDGKITKLDLGNRDIEGISAHGLRWTLRYDVNQDGQIVQRTRIHEVWASAEMQIIIRVIDGDPNGEETVWGLEKISLAPDGALFRPPEGYDMTHREYSDLWAAGDFEKLKTWFEK
ncbi:MAG: hypothetical protein WCA10_01730 [Terracidiphilus sp.]